MSRSISLTLRFKGLIMKKLMIITLALLTFSNISMAVPKPDVCPDADAIRATPLAAATEIDDDLYTEYIRSVGSQS